MSIALSLFSAGGEKRKGTRGDPCFQGDTTGALAARWDDDSEPTALLRDEQWPPVDDGRLL